MKLVAIGYISKKTFGEIRAANGHIITTKCNKTAAFGFI
jgi:hypothetical protein